MKKVAIIGCGVSALGCAVSLKEKGIDFTIFEKSGRCGGKVFSEKEDGFILEAGADSYLPEKYWTVQLIKKIGIEKEMLTTNEEFKGTFLYSKGRLHQLPEGIMLMVPTMIMPLVRSSLISWPGKIRMGMELFMPVRKEGGDESLADFVTRRLGRECLEKIAEPLVAGIHTSNPDNMSVQSTFPRFVEMERNSGSLIRGMVAAMKKMPPKKPGAPAMTFFMSLKQGMQQFADSAVEFAGRERLRLNTDVISVTKTHSGYRVVTTDGSQDFDAVVLSTPAYVSSGIIREMDPDLAGLLDRIEWSSSATINVAFRKADVQVKLPGFGFIVPRVENRRINATTWSSVKWSYRAPDDHLLIRSFVGGGHHEELVDLPDDEMIRIVLGELRDIAGIDAKPVLTKIYRWTKGMPKYTVGHKDRIAVIDDAVKKHRGLYLIGCSYKGIGIGDSVKSGLDAAEAIGRELLH